MTRLFFILLIAVTGILFYGCGKPGCIGSRGTTLTLSRELSAFDTLVLEDNIDLVLVQGNTNRAEITAGEHILPNILTDQTGRTLKIANTTSCRWLRDGGERVHVRLVLSDLRFIEYKGSGNISSEDTLRLEKLRIESSIGAGDVELTVNIKEMTSVIFSENTGIIVHGRTDYYACYTDARSQLDLSDLTSRYIGIEYGGLADTEVHATEELSVQINYHGNVYYRGNPVIVKLLEFSSGRLIHRP